MHRRRVAQLRRWLWAAMITCVLGGVWLDLTVRVDAIPLRGQTNAYVGTAPIKVKYTGTTWFAKPIFSITNQSASQVLDGIALRSWSQDLLPVIAVSQTQPDTWPHNSEELPHPPYSLQPHETMWFVGPVDPPEKFYFYWTSDGRPVHEVLNVGASP